jgi:hypothetical protein
VRFQPDTWFTAGFELAQPLTRAPGQAEGRKPLRLLVDFAARF